MSNRIGTPEFLSTYVESLGPGEEAYQCNTFPGVYPSDIASHHSARAGNGPIINLSYQSLLHRLYNQGAVVRRLRVLPAPGQFGYTQQDVDTIRSAAITIAGAYEDVRVADFDSCKTRLLSTFDKNAPLVQRYLNGVEAHDPKASTWSTRRLTTGTGKLALTYVGILDYDNGQFLGHGAYPQTDTAPIPDDVQAYEAFWREVYFTQAESITQKR